ncbi:MAG: hypothetical protein VX341_10745, partial [Bdellovibrionota bacterium]|nr:hypothetical protein [Bdellovibrionota bacterium]
TQTVNLSVNFVREDVDFPRLEWESSQYKTPKCMVDPVSRLTLAEQAISPHFRGTSNETPLVICDTDHFIEMQGYSTSFLSMENPIPLMTNPTLANSGISFTGKFNGKDNYIYGYNNTHTGSAKALFGTIAANGEIKNIKMYNNTISDTSNNNIGILGFSNAGTIKNVSMVNNSIISGTKNYIGLISNNNTNLIEDIEVDHLSKIKSSGNYIGLVTAQNSGTIKRASIEGQLELNSDTTIQRWGGISGNNSADISEIVFGGSIDLTVLTSPRTSSLIGGITGANTGDIKDVKLTEYAYVNLGFDNSDSGLVAGSNSSPGNISNIVSESLFIHQTPLDSSDGSIVGNMLGGTIDSGSTFYLYPPASSLGGYAINGSPVDNTGDQTCSITFTPTTLPLTISALQDTENYLPVISSSSSNITVDYSNASENFDCSTLSGLTIYSYGSASLNGTRKSLQELTDYKTYCSGDRALDDIFFECNESFYSIYDGFDDGEITSINPILKNVLRVINRESLTGTEPKWIFEARRTPEPYFD